MKLTLHEIAKATNGKVHGDDVRCPGPGQSAQDRSLSVKLSSNGSGDDFIVHSFAGDDPNACRDHVRDALGRKPFKPQSEPVAIYDYVDENGSLVFQVCRYDTTSGKTFRQRQPDGRDGWKWNVKGVRKVPYRCPQLAKAIGQDLTIFIAEGEKCVDRLAALDVPATCNAGGAGKWREELTQHFEGARVAILPDNDAPGKAHAYKVAEMLNRVAAEIRIVRLPGLAEHGDIANWLDSGGTVDQLHALAADAQLYRPDEPGKQTLVMSIASFCSAYTPLSYTVEEIIRSASLYTVTGKTGHNKTTMLIAAAYAVATGRQDILGRDVERGRVAYITVENPDDVRMKFIVTANRLNISLDSLADSLFIIDRKETPEAIIAALVGLGPLSLVICDTLAAMFDGDNINDAVQGGDFMRRLRPITQLRGLPAVVVAAHPVKNATRETLVPYGSGAILNEIDGNLTLWREGSIASLHWQGKLRGLDFAPVPFKSELWGCNDVVDTKRRQVMLPVLLPTTIEATDERERNIGKRNKSVLDAIFLNPKATQRELMSAAHLSSGTLNRALKDLKKRVMIEKGVDESWRLTPKGKREIDA